MYIVYIPVKFAVSFSIPMGKALQHSKHNSSGQLEEWFENLINSIKVDKLQLETNTAHPLKKSLYDNLMGGNEAEVISEMRKMSSQYFIECLIRDYLTELNQRNVQPVQLAFDLNDAKILVWAEISDNDEDSEDGLILAEAKVNNEYSKFGIHISSTIIEKCDKLNVPAHYRSILD